MGDTGTQNPRFSRTVVVVQPGKKGAEVSERSASVRGTEGAADDTAPPGALCGDDFFRARSKSRGRLRGAEVAFEGVLQVSRREKDALSRCESRVGLAHGFPEVHQRSRSVEDHRAKIHHGPLRPAAFAPRR